MSIKTRISKLVADSAARNHKGPLLTLDDGADHLYVSSVAAIEVARAAGKHVIMPDDDFDAGVAAARATGKRIVIIYHDPGPENTFDFLASRSLLRHGGDEAGPAKPIE